MQSTVIIPQTIQIRPLHICCLSTPQILLRKSLSFNLHSRPQLQTTRKMASATTFYDFKPLDSACASSFLPLFHCSSPLHIPLHIN